MALQGAPCFLVSCRGLAAGRKAPELLAKCDLNLRAGRPKGAAAPITGMMWQSDERAMPGS